MTCCATDFPFASSIFCFSWLRVLSFLISRPSNNNNICTTCVCVCARGYGKSKLLLMNRDRRREKGGGAGCANEMCGQMSAGRGHPIIVYVLQTIQDVECEEEGKRIHRKQAKSIDENRNEFSTRTKEQIQYNFIFVVPCAVCTVHTTTI